MRYEREKKRTSTRINVTQSYVRQRFEVDLHTLCPSGEHMKTVSVSAPLFRYRIG